jgi:hypothetical protein
MLAERVALYKEIEQARGRPMLVYVTSNRVNANGGISADVVGELQDQLHALPAGTEGLDLLLVSDGGDATVAWRIVSLIRERVKNFSVLVPHAAYSAATLIVLGADEIVMHPNGNLGPTDPQISAPKPGGAPGERQSFGSEDLAAFMKYAKDTVGLKEEAHLSSIYEKFVDGVGPIPIGVAARGSQLGVTMGEKLLQLHMKGDNEKAEAKKIAQRLTKDFFHHGYPLNRSEAKDIGLKVTNPDAALEALLWRVWVDISAELQLRVPFNAMGLVRANPNAAALFAPVPLANVPANLPPALLQQAYQAILAGLAITQVPETPYENIHALFESDRLASRYISRGAIFALRQADLSYKVSNVVDAQRWETVTP